MTNEMRSTAFVRAQELRLLLREWNATSDPIKRAVVADALTFLEKLPLPDDLAEDSE